ncbi:N-acetyl-alpha-D-glucosaminyl L-malate synthase BshA [Thermaerobacter sp. FW80]|uniref:N-acetyl-alpha-D-glucosaminyl L-malate synthase BshA n=1 Tax=Thermaerobacter sp. FW80 TaxID=2546351 RepID=UPI001FAAEDB7|nr:N-acetyl-alpha-D-glucosaminyl L-malate synthase BshA [Thermaerobacter sp. FW80]
MRTAPAHRGLPAWDEGLAAPAIPDHLAIHDNALADAVLDVRQPFGPGRGTSAAACPPGVAPVDPAGDAAGPVRPEEPGPGAGPAPAHGPAGVAADRRPLRIGISCYPSSGGSGVVATELGHQLAARGHQVHFISHDVPFRLDLTRPGIHFHPVEVPSYPLFTYPPYDLALANQMAAVAETWGLDLLHVHYAIPHATAAYLARAMLGPGRPLRVVTTLHGTDITLLGTHPSFQRIVEFSINRSDAVTVVSHHLREATLAAFRVERPLEVIPNFVDPAVFHPPRHRDDPALRRGLAEPGERVLVHVSNFRPAKDAPTVIAVFARVCREVPARLLLVGHGPDVDRCAHMAHQLGIADRVRFLGEHADVARLLAAADLFLLPSRQEAFGLAALEAMACGVPVVAARTGGLPEVVEHGRTGYLLPPGDVEGMARCALELLRDPDRHAAFARAAAETARRRFAAEAIVPRYEALYRRLLATAPANATAGPGGTAPSPGDGAPSPGRVAAGTDTPSVPGRDVR